MSEREDVTTASVGTPVIGKMTVTQAATKLRELGDVPALQMLDEAIASGRGAITLESFHWPWAHPTPPPAYAWTGHAFGFLPCSPPDVQSIDIKHAGNMPPDVSLKNQRVNVRLARLRVADYPGGGVHRVLFDFYAQNQLPGGQEHLHFCSTFRVQEGQQAAVIGHPIFVGINVGSQGLAFGCKTVNISNDDDEKFLSFLGSDVLKAGLKLIQTAQPAIGPLSQVMLGLATGIGQRNKNVPVQEFFMGLDFARNPMGARLAEGDYVAVQIPDTMAVGWSWQEWVYQSASGALVRRDDATKPIPYNYVVFSVTRYED